MLKIFFIMVAAMIIGWTLRNKSIPRHGLSIAISGVIMAMMMLIGIEMGGSESVISLFKTIFRDVILLTMGAIGGTVVIAWIVNRTLIKSKPEKISPNNKKGSYWFSILIVCIFFAGVLLGYLGLRPFIGERSSIWALYILMALVGFNIGSDTKALKALRNQHWKVILVPLVTIVGTYLGIIALSPLVELGIADQLAIGSGFGYYSLSSVLISELRGIEIGAIALMVNVSRELVTVIAAPFIVRYFSPIALICSGGATTIDVTMPVIMRYCGSSFIGMAIFQGVVVDLSVPFLVTFFASL